jgi:hypothetical protein
MRIIITGGRNYPHLDLVGQLLSSIYEIRKIKTVVHGACPSGADLGAHLWAGSVRDVEEEPHPAKWNTQGKGAGMVRNGEMAKLGADLCIAFPGGNGTADMVDQALAANIPILDLRS